MSSQVQIAEWEDITDGNISAYCSTLAKCSVIASRTISTIFGHQRTAALCRVAMLLRQRAERLQEENEKDLALGREAGLTTAMLDRLTLDDKRIESMAQSVIQIADQPDPIGQIIEGRVLPNGIKLQKLRVPLGVVLIIFESRPNVTSDAAALCVKSGNAVILRGGKESRLSNAAIAACVRDGLKDEGIDPNCVQLVGTTNREVVGQLLKLEGSIDLCIPRGGESLIRAVVEQAHIPVIKHYAGNCHVYVDSECDEQMAIDICVNAKTQRPGVCNAVETLLFHADTANAGLLTRICQTLADHGVQIRGDAQVCRRFPKAQPVSEKDWSTEFLDLVVAVRVVDDLRQAVEHINQYGSQHTDAIVTSDAVAANAFVDGVDSGNVFVNCSTRFSDGGEYGLGAEIGISTDKLHARGPMGAADLTTYKWVAHGDGQVRQ